MYDVTVRLDGRFWYVEVPAIERATQARNLREVTEMAQDLIEVMTGESGAEIQVHLDLPEAIDAHMQTLAALRATEAEARSGAAAESRRLARMLRDQSLTLADVGAVLGVSHQRADQLIKEAEELV